MSSRRWRPSGCARFAANRCAAISRPSRARSAARTGNGSSCRNTRREPDAERCNAAVTADDVLGTREQPDTWRDYYRQMVLIRSFELRAAEMYQRAKIG